MSARVGEDRVIENRFEGSDVGLRHTLELLLIFLFFSPEFFHFLESLHTRARAGAPPLLLMASPRHEADVALEIQTPFTHVRKWSGSDPSCLELDSLHIRQQIPADCGLR